MTSLRLVRDDAIPLHARSPYKTRKRGTSYHSHETPSSFDLTVTPAVISMDSMKRNLLLPSLLSAVMVGACVGPGGREGPPEVPLLPGGYRVILDGNRPDPGQFTTAETPDGIRVTTGPAGIAWRPGDTISYGDFRVEATFTLMGAPVAYREGYGVFVGGRNLDGPSPRYLYLMVRPTGEYMVRRRVGSATETLVDWIPHEAVQGVLADGDSPVNAIAIEARGPDVRFLVNGIVVFLLPLEEARPTGLAGLRVNHRLDLVLTSWSLGPPPPDAPVAP